MNFYFGIFYDRLMDDGDRDADDFSIIYSFLLSEATNVTMRQANACHKHTT